MKKYITNVYVNTLRLLSIILGIYYLFDGKPNVILNTLLFIGISLIPFLLQKKYKIKLSNLLIFVFATLTFSGTVLGGGMDLYKYVFWLDDLSHFLSGIFSFLLGLEISKRMNLNTKYRLFFIFTFCCAMTLSWEIVEFISDSIFKTNMQEWTHVTKEPFIPLVKERGHGLVDSMMDMIYALLGYTFSSIIYKINKKKNS